LQPSPLAALPWPLAVIDFEASSLDQDSYPIEVGLALWPAPGEPILGWSALIRPAGDWTRHGHWSPASGKVHGIRGSDILAHGQSPEQVAAALNAALGPGAVAWCDGGPYDAHWAGALFKAGGIKPLFALGDWHRLAAMLGTEGRERALAWLDRAPTRHRARGDAEQLLLALAHGAEIEAGPVQDFAGRLPALAALAMPGEGASPCGQAP
jgi:DNA polymerase-3 subunit epsilon